MAQQLIVEIALTTIGVDKRTIRIFRHGINGQIAAYQILFQADIFSSVKGKSLIAMA